MNTDEYRISVTGDYVFFLDGVLSNSYPVVIPYEYKGKDYVFHSTEQEFMFFKALFFNDNETAENILKCTTPKEAKTLGRQVKNYDESLWNTARESIMERCISDKFGFCIEFADELKMFRGKTFVQCIQNDKIWSCGLSIDDKFGKRNDNKNWTGKNLLGKILTKAAQYTSPIHMYENSLVYVDINTKERWSLNGKYIGFLKKDSNWEIGYVLNHPIKISEMPVVNEDEIINGNIIAGESNIDECAITSISRVEDDSIILKWYNKYLEFHNAILDEKDYDPCTINSVIF